MLPWEGLARGHFGVSAAQGRRNVGEGEALQFCVTGWHGGPGPWGDQNTVGRAYGNKASAARWPPRDRTAGPDEKSAVHRCAGTG